MLAFLHGEHYQFLLESCFGLYFCILIADFACAHKALICKMSWSCHPWAHIRNSSWTCLLSVLTLSFLSLKIYFSWWCTFILFFLSTFFIFLSKWWSWAAKSRSSSFNFSFGWDELESSSSSCKLNFPWKDALIEWIPYLIKYFSTLLQILSWNLLKTCRLQCLLQLIPFKFLF